MSIIKEFKEFAIKGNVIDLAVAVVIGGAFNKIVSSLVTDIITPPLGLMTQGVDFKSWNLGLNASGTAKLQAGQFIQAIVDFTITAFAMFVVVKGINALKKRAEKSVVVETEQPKLTNEELLLKEIRDLLRDQAQGIRKAV